MLVCFTYAVRTEDEFYKRTFSIPLRLFDGKTTYYCISQPIAADQYMFEFKPIVERDLIKHMSFSLCDEPYSTEPIWDCIDSKRVCKGPRDSLYAWTNYAPGLKLPKNSGIHTGHKRRYLVFQMHGPPQGVKEGDINKWATMVVKFRSSRPRYHAATGAFGNTGNIPPHVKHFKTDSACMWNITGRVPILSYALHSHLLGRTASAYIIRNGQWIEIGKGDPRYPVTYFDITDRHLYLEKGDIMAVRCTFNNPTDRYVKFGHHATDEMCNLYMFYGTDTDAPQEDRSYICSSDSRSYHWEDHFQNIPQDSTDISGNTDQRLYKNAHKGYRIAY